MTIIVATRFPREADVRDGSIVGLANRSALNLESAADGGTTALSLVISVSMIWCLEGVPAQLLVQPLRAKKPERLLKGRAALEQGTRFGRSASGSVPGGDGMALSVVARDHSRQPGKPDEAKPPHVETVVIANRVHARSWTSSRVRVVCANSLSVGISNSKGRQYCANCRDST